MNLNAQIKQRIDGVVLRLYYLFSVKLSAVKKKKRILIVKNDSIGDYIIFRNFLSEIKKTEKLSDHELFILTRTRLKPVIQELDGNLLTEIIEFRNDGFKNLQDRINYYRFLRSYKFEYILHPTYSPDSKTQQLIKFIDARYKIGFYGDTSNQSARDKKYYEKYYSKLVYATNKYSHEFEKNFDFFTAVLQRKIDLDKPRIEIPLKKDDPGEIIICPGAQHQQRMWPAINFGRVIAALAEKYPDLKFIVATGPGEEELFEHIKGQTLVLVKHYKILSVLDFAALIGSARLVICNDSAPAHISVACDSNSVCISNGNHYKRFVPYPETMGVKQKVILPQRLLEATARKDYNNHYYFGSDLNINEITVSEVLNACFEYLKSRTLK